MVIIIKKGTPEAAIRQLLAQLSMQNVKGGCVAGEEGICRGCGIASLSISYFDLGYATGEMAYEVLVEGADPATMQIRFAPQFTKICNPTNCEALNITVPEEYVALG